MEKEYRRVIADSAITSSKSYNDFLYGWIVLNSVEETGIRFILKKDFVYTQLEEELEMSRKTMAKYFDYLVEIGAIVEGKDRWIISELGDKGFWIERDILERIIEMKVRYALSIYVYLVKGYYVAGQPQLVVLMENVKGFIGVSTNIRSNNYIVADIFEAYREMGLLNCQLWYDKDTNKRFYKLMGVGKTNYF